MDLEQYKMTIAGRFNDLNEDEVESLRGLLGTPAAKVITKIFGPEMDGVVALGTPQKPMVKKRGLATR